MLTPEQLRAKAPDLFAKDPVEIPWGEHALNDQYGYMVPDSTQMRSLNIDPATLTDSIYGWKMLPKSATGGEQLYFHYGEPAQGTPVGSYYGAGGGANGEFPDMYERVLLGGNDPEKNLGFLSNTAPVPRLVQSAPDEGWLQQFMQGPAIPLFAFAGAGALGAAGIAAEGAAAGGAAAAEAALGELGINTALAAGEAGGIAAGTSIADLASSFTPQALFGASVSALEGSFGDIIANAFSPENLAQSAVKNIVTSAVTGRDVTPASIATGMIGGAAGSAASGAVGALTDDSLLGSAAKTAAGAGVGAAVGAGVNQALDGGRSSTPSAALTHQTIAAATPGSGANEMPTSFDTVLSAYQPQFQRNT